jgi:hypothetical protein
VLIPQANLPTAPRAVAPPAEKSLDQLLDELEALRAQKAELEKKEAELTKAIRQKAERQADRMNRLGLGAAPGLPDRVGRVVLVGGAGKDEKTILDLLGLVPGQALSYPALEVARARLVKAGYRSATVEVRPGEEGYKDVVVTVGETDR